MISIFVNFRERPLGIKRKNFWNKEYLVNLDFLDSFKFPNSQILIKNTKVQLLNKSASLHLQGEGIPPICTCMVVRGSTVGS